MSWPTWSAAAAPIPTAVAAPVQSTLIPTAINSAPSVMPPGLQYSPEQWAQAQQQNWQQWAQWQQQYQQWHQQYGAEYQKSMNAMQERVTSTQPPLPSLPNTGVPPPLPVENKPPLPPEDPPVNQPSAVLPSYSTMPLKPAQGGYSTLPPPHIPQQMQPTSQVNPSEQYGQRQNWQSNTNKRPFNQEKEYENTKRPAMDRPNQWRDQKQAPNQWQAQQQQNVHYHNQPPPQTAPPYKANIEELSEAEKKFDKEFAAWESQFNKWKEQNASHPDKTQYKEYEKKWESWRNSLLERREQMRRKRLALSGAVAPNQKPPSLNTPQSGSYVSQSGTYLPSTGPTQPGPHPLQSGVHPSQSSLVPPQPGIHSSQTVSRPSSVEKKQSLGSTHQVTADSQINKPEFTRNLEKKSDNLYNNPPPHQNNEPLSFKASSDYTTVGSSSNVDNSAESFLKPSSSGGIPGLDLVKDDDGKEASKEEIIDLDTEEKPQENVEQSTPKGPDFDAISKGINTILGDQKLLSMLSMVSQNPPTNPGPSVTTDTVSNITSGYPHARGNFSAPPPPTPQQYNKQAQQGNFPPFNEQSNQSFDDMSNQGDYYQQREVVNNFDDQTRSSFTMGPNDQEQSYKNRFPSNRFGAAPPDVNRMNNRNNFGPSLKDNAPNLDNMADNRNKFGPSRDYNNFSQKPGNFYQGNRANNFNRSENFGSKDNYDKYNRSDNFQEDHFENNYRYDKYANSRGNFGGSSNNFNRPGNFNQRDGYNNNFSHSGNYNRETNYDDYENYDDDYDKYHNLFNEEDQPGAAENESLRPVPQQDAYDDMPQEPPVPEIVEARPTEDPIFEPASVIDYDHKSQRPTEPEVVVEPIYMFDYRHKPLNRIPLPQRPKWLAECVKFIREFDPLASRGSLAYDRMPMERYPPPNPRDLRWDDWRPENREDRYGPRGHPYDDRDREFFGDYENRGRVDRRPFRDEPHMRLNDDRHRHKFNDNDRYSKTHENVSRNEEKRDGTNIKSDFEELSDDDMDWEAGEQRKLHQDKKSRSRSPILSNPPNPSTNFGDVAMVEDIINPPGRFNRPPRIVIILRGPPGSGKTYLARLIKDKEVENGGSAPRILSLDDYFMVEHEKEVFEDGKIVKVKEMVYEYEAEMEDAYRASFIKSFKKTITDGYFPFIIVDNVNDKVKYFGEMWSFAKQNGFQVYICQMDLDPVLCTKRNIHNRSEAEIEECIAGWEPTPSHHPTIDASGLLQASTIPEVEMEEAETLIEESNIKEVPEVRDQVRSKWDTFDCSSHNLAKLDGVSKPLRRSRTMEEYLQLEEEWQPQRSSKPGQKRVRWADLEEQRKQEKMRAIGFVVGHTDWDRMMDPTGGSNALIQTKYIERINRF